MPARLKLRREAKVSAESRARSPRIWWSPTSFTLVWGERCALPGAAARPSTLQVPRPSNRESVGDELCCHLNAGFDMLFVFPLLHPHGGGHLGR